MEANSLFIGVALLILLAVTSMRYGVDSRDGFRATRGEAPRRGIVWDARSADQPPLPKSEVAATRPVPVTTNCALEPCAA